MSVDFCTYVHMYVHIYVCIHTYVICMYVIYMYKSHIKLTHVADPEFIFFRFCVCVVFLSWKSRVWYLVSFSMCSRKVTGEVAIWSQNWLNICSFFQVCFRTFVCLCSYAHAGRIHGAPLRHFPWPHWLREGSGQCRRRYGSHRQCTRSFSVTRAQAYVWIKLVSIFVFL